MLGCSCCIHRVALARPCLRVWIAEAEVLRKGHVPRYDQAFVVYAMLVSLRVNEFPENRAGGCSY